MEEEGVEVKCKFEIAWVGRCKEEADQDGLCSEHAKLTCSSCGAQATRSCDETFGLVCGASLCSDCEHEIAPDGTNGRSGRHVKKGEQKFKLWIEQNEEETRVGKYLMWKRQADSYRRLITVAHTDGVKSPDHLVRYLSEAEDAMRGMEANHPELVGLTE